MNRRTFKGLAVTAALVCLGAVGCTDTTVEPTSAITEANIFNDPSSYRAFIAKIYAGLAVSGQQGPAGQADISGIDEGFSQYLRLYWEHQELPSDEAVIGWGDIGLPEMNTQTWTSQSNMVVAMYYRIFFQVTLANEFLRQTEDAKLASRGIATSSTLYGQIQTYRAEARFLRALSYAHGLDLFGNIPLVTEADPVGATPPAQATRTAIYNYVVSELTAIVGALPTATGNYGRATAGAANMLLAHVYLNASVYTGSAQYAAALAAASAVIAGPYSIDPNYSHLFKADNNTSPEIVFPITQDGQRTQTWGGVTFLAHASCGGNMSNSTYGIDGCWWGLRLKPEAYNRYQSPAVPAGDGRASYFFGPGGTTGQNLAIGNIGNFNDGVAAPKFQNVTSTGAAGSNATHVDTDFPLYRLADAYLIYVEAFLRGGGGTQAQALTYFNALRQRAYGNASGNITLTQLNPGAPALQLVLDERGRELLWEAHRRSDLVRYGLFTGATYVWSWKGGTQAGATTAARYDLFPLPASEIVANPNLTQNPGY